MGKKHLLKCWLWKGLWGFSFISFLLAWASVLMQVPIGPLDALFLFWNALILGVLAISIKLDCQTCEVCTVAPRQG